MTKGLADSEWAYTASNDGRKDKTKKCSTSFAQKTLRLTKTIRYHQVIEQDFLEHGGVKERMTAARKGYRTSEKEYVRELEQTILQLQQQIKEQQNTIENQKTLIDKLMKKGKD